MPSHAPQQSILGLLDARALDDVGSFGVPSLPASNEGLEAQFLGKVHGFFRMWLEAKGEPQKNAKPCAIVLSRSISQDTLALGASRIHYFNSTADVEIEGAVLIANSDLSVVAKLPAPKCANPAALGTKLEQLGLHSAMHCVMLPHRGEMILCRDGLDGGSTRIVIEQRSEIRLSAPALDEKLVAFHRKFTQTSAGVLRPWKSAQDRILIDEAELRISLMLGTYLGMILGDDNVSVEDQQPHGRVDIKVSRHAMQTGLGACALECKVLRSREPLGSKHRAVSLSKMVKHASEGVQQAYEYRLDLGGTLAYLCCFDAREQDEDQPAVVSLAKLRDVTLRRYYMHPSPHEHRTAELAALPSTNR